MLKANQTGFFPYTPATNLLFGLREAIRMLLDEGLEAVFARHARLAEATRRAVRAWGLEVLCRHEHECSGSLTAVRMPGGHSADALRAQYGRIVRGQSPAHARWLTPELASG